MGSAMSDTTMNALLDQVTKATADVKQLAGNDAMRRKLIEASRKLSEALETPGESMQRILYKVRERLIISYRLTRLADDISPSTS